MRRPLLGLLVILLLGACGIGAGVSAPEAEDYRPIDLSRSDIVGTWSNPTKVNVIEFFDDGRFVAHNLPPELLPEGPGFVDDRFADAIEATGTWRLWSGFPDHPQKHPLTVVDLTLDVGPVILQRGETELNADWDSEHRDRVVLMFYAGMVDLNDRREFFKD